MFATFTVVTKNGPLTNAYKLYILYSVMPVVLRFGRFSFVIYPQDHQPAHVHVKAAEAEARFEIETGKCLAVYGFKQKTISQLAKIIKQNKDLLMEAWNEYQGK